ncbi:MAG: hypothetical protein KIT84_22520 [Labilithrix sp.]|nr:hypothetical protein [Labilithrix sp.]MCW5813819.1 hypothetical protein [Labilithrix sp.]
MKIALVPVLALALVACGDDDKKTDDPKGSSGYTDHSSPYPACDAIIKACHPLDTGEGTIHDCHDQGHLAKSEADCTPVKDMCLAACVADGGSPQ